MRDSQGTKPFSESLILLLLCLTIRSHFLLLTELTTILPAASPANDNDNDDSDNDDDDDDNDIDDNSNSSNNSNTNDNDDDTL